MVRQALPSLQTALSNLSSYASAPQGRLTLTTAVPVLTVAATAQGTVYYTPYTGALIPIYDGTRYNARILAELSNVLANSATGSAGPAAGVSNANYDLFAWDNAGTLTLTRGALWSKNATVTTPVATPGVVNWNSHGLLAGTPVSFSGGVLPTGIVAGTTYYVISAGLGANSFEISATVGGAAINFTVASSGTQTGVAGNDTARSTATENDLQMVQGVLTNLNAITNGPGAGLGTYLGTVRTNSSGATVTFDPGTAAAGGSNAWSGVWNMYNRRFTEFRSIDSTASWSYTTATIRAANASNSNRISFIKGLNEDGFRASYTQTLTTAAAASANGAIGCALDSTTTLGSAGGSFVKTTAAVTMIGTPSAPLLGLAGLGQHFIQATELGDGTNATVFGGTGQNVLEAGLWW